MMGSRRFLRGDTKIRLFPGSYFDPRGIEQALVVAFAARGGGGSPKSGRHYEGAPRATPKQSWPAYVDESRQRRVGSQSSWIELEKVFAERF